SDMLLAAVEHPGEREQLQRRFMGADSAEDTRGQDEQTFRYRPVGTE
ncbi:MAG: hypothetical protein HUK06_08920, partial [Bacteroidaceae bacterium]|nr:hypothetical protein [Bacteroidaceae bacterium]